MASATTPETQPGSQPGGILFKLPKELRLQIYGMMFPPGRISLFSFRDHLKLAPNRSQPYVYHYYHPRQTARDYIAMLTTCHAVYDEVKLILYENTEFHIHCSWDPVCRSSILYTMGTMFKPQWKLWRDCSPEVDVFTHLQYARSILLDVYLDTTAMHDDSWMHRMPLDLSGALNLRKLHISVRSFLSLHTAEFQAQADQTMSLIGMIKSKCLVTAAMEAGRWDYHLTSPYYVLHHLMATSLGNTSFQSASYYAMLSTLKGTDKTHEAYSRPLVIMSNHRDYVQQGLAVKYPQLMEISSELAEIKKDQSWSEGPASKATAETLSTERLELLKAIDDLQKSYGWVPIEIQIQMLEQQRDLLLSGRDTLIESV